MGRERASGEVRVGPLESPAKKRSLLLCRTSQWRSAARTQSLARRASARRRPSPPPSHGPRGGVESRPQRSVALTRAPASQSDAEKAASPPVPLLRSVKGSGENRSKDAVEAGPPVTPFNTTARAPWRVPACGVRAGGDVQCVMKHCAKNSAVGLLSPNSASHRHSNVAGEIRRRGEVAVAEETALQHVVEELWGKRKATIVPAAAPSPDTPAQR